MFITSNNPIRCRRFGLKAKLWLSQRVIYDEPKTTEVAPTSSETPNTPPPLETRLTQAQIQLKTAQKSLEKKLAIAQGNFSHDNAPKLLRDIVNVQTEANNILQRSETVHKGDATEVEHSVESLDSTTTRLQAIEKEFEKFAYREARRSLNAEYDSAGIVLKEQIEARYKVINQQYGIELPRDSSHTAGLGEGGMDRHINTLKDIQDVDLVKDSKGELDDTAALEALDKIKAKDSNPLRISMLKAQKKVDLAVTKAKGELAMSHPEIPKDPTNIEQAIVDMNSFAQRMRKGEAEFVKDILPNILADYEYEINETVIKQYSRGKHADVKAQTYIETEAKKLESDLWNQQPEEYKKKKGTIHSIREEYSQKLANAQTPQERQQILLDYKIQLDFITQKIATAKGYIRSEALAAAKRKPHKKEEIDSIVNTFITGLEDPTTSAKDIQGILEGFRDEISKV